MPNRSLRNNLSKLAGLIHKYTKNIRASINYRYHNVYNDSEKSRLQVPYVSVIARATFLVLDFTIKYTLIKGFQISKCISNYFLSQLRYFATNHYV